MSATPCEGGTAGCQKCHRASHKAVFAAAAANHHRCQNVASWRQSACLPPLLPMLYATPRRICLLTGPRVVLRCALRCDIGHLCQIHRCENCKAMAPSMREVEEQFKNQINFVVVDGSAAKNYDLVSVRQGSRFTLCPLFFVQQTTRLLAWAPRPSLSAIDAPVTSWVLELWYHMHLNCKPLLLCVMQ